MKIWITRHGQTNLNKAHLMQGRTDEPLNETGIAQAEEARALIGDMHFDAVYASPLDRAVKTAEIIGGVKREDIIIDPRIIETDFGRYEKKKYWALGLPMTLYWRMPTIMRAPRTVEPLSSMIERSSSFLREIEQKDYDNVLIVCHGGIMRALRGYLSDAESGVVWRPKPKNCEIDVYESADGKHRFVRKYLRGKSK